jgi:hypothetical protein
MTVWKGERSAHSFHGRIAVPSQTDGLRAFCLLETAKVEFQFFVVKVYRGDGCTDHKSSIEYMTKVNSPASLGSNSLSGLNTMPQSHKREVLEIRLIAYQVQANSLRWPISAVQDYPDVPIVPSVFPLSHKRNKSTNPVLGRLTHKRALASASTGVTLNWMSAGAYEVV